MASIVPPGRLAYGMQLQVQSQSRIYAEAVGGRRRRRRAGRRSPSKADETGFFYVAVCDHVAIPKPLDERMNTIWYDTVATLGWLAAHHDEGPSAVARLRASPTATRWSPRSRS